MAVSTSLDVRPQGQERIMHKPSIKGVLVSFAGEANSVRFLNRIKGTFTTYIQDHFKPLSLLILAVLFWVADGAYASPSNASLRSIAEARHLPLGTLVTVEGTVTTPSGAFESSFFDKGFGLQDDTAGIYVSLPNNLEVLPGRRARISGTLQDSYGLLILVPTDSSDVHLDGNRHPIHPQWVTTGRIGEATEGRIVRVVGKITQAPISDLPYGNKFFVDDGSGVIQIFVNIQTGIDVSLLKPGQWVSVAGFSSQFETHYEIDPRSPHDIDVPMR